jgi:hypothetical protein
MGSAPARPDAPSGPLEDGRSWWIRLPARAFLATVALLVCLPPWRWAEHELLLSAGGLLGLTALAEAVVGLVRGVLSPLPVPARIRSVGPALLVALICLMAARVPAPLGGQLAWALALGAVSLGAMTVAAWLPRASRQAAGITLILVILPLIPLGHAALKQEASALALASLPMMLILAGLSARAARQLLPGPSAAPARRVAGLAAGLFTLVGVITLLSQGAAGIRTSLPPGWSPWFPAEAQVAETSDPTPPEPVTDEADPTPDPTPDPVASADDGELLRSATPAAGAPWILGGQPEISSAPGAGPEGQDAARVRFGGEPGFVAQLVTGQPASGRRFTAHVWLRSGDEQEEDVDLILRDEREELPFRRIVVTLTPTWTRHELVHRFRESESAGDVVFQLGNNRLRPDAQTILAWGASLREVAP